MGCRFSGKGSWKSLAPPVLPYDADRPLVSPMTKRKIFSRLELAALRESLPRDGTLPCPRCRVPMESSPVPRPPGVSYVRRRRWYLCPSCGRSAVLDLPRPESTADESGGESSRK
ncbi:MAG: hypothetical protein EA422_07785 [Gemmatimonadales bacterium]|nr:MAG: hypothetical protein EA422_07785 [Gemmatimonadales bacterium]